MTADLEAAFKVPEAGAASAFDVRCQGTFVRSSDGRSWPCLNKLAEQVTAPWRIRCRKCKSVNEDTGGGHHIRTD